MVIKALEERPAASAEHAWLWTAFNRLATTRQLTGYGQGPISWLALHAYAKELGLTPDERDLLWDVVRRLDHKFLSITAAKTKAQAPRGKG